MKRCPHDNCEIYATHAQVFGFQFMNGALVVVDGDACETGVLLYIDVSCSDCNLYKRYTKGHVPKWVYRKMNTDVDLVALYDYIGGDPLKKRNSV